MENNLVKLQNSLRDLGLESMSSAIPEYLSMVGRGDKTAVDVISLTASAFSPWLPRLPSPRPRRRVF